MRILDRAACILLLLASSAPAAAAVSGEVFVKLPAGSAAAGHDRRVGILSYAFGPAGPPGEWIADVERPAARSGRGLDIAHVDGETVSPAGSSQTLTVGGNRTESGPSAGPRRQQTAAHAAPPATGSVTLRLKSPWPNCRVGKLYPQLELGGQGASWTLKDAVITHCATGRGTAKSVTLAYRRLES
jgi:hypothetical protein